MSYRFRKSNKHSSIIITRNKSRDKYLRHLGGGAYILYDQQFAAKIIDPKNLILILYNTCSRLNIKKVHSLSKELLRKIFPYLGKSVFEGGGRAGPRP